MMTLPVFILALVALGLAVLTLRKPSPLAAAVVLLAIGELLLTWSAHGALK